jgi:hypothetical protein
VVVVDDGNNNMSMVHDAIMIAGDDVVAIVGKRQLRLLAGE